MICVPGQAFADCAGPAGVAGDMVYNKDHAVFQYCDGTDWFAAHQTVTPAGTDCTGPASPEGATVFNRDYRVLQGCARGNWVSFAPLPATVIDDTGLIGYWRMDEETGNAIDMINGNNGVHEDGVVYASTGGKIRGAADFTDGTIVVPPVPLLANISPISVCVWVYPRSYPDSYPILVDKSSLSDGSDGFNFYLRNIDTFGFYTILGGYKERATIVLNKWQHLCATWDGSADYNGIKLYRNGVEATTGGEENIIATSTDDTNQALNFGRNNANIYPLDGKLDDVRIYNRVLGATEIADIYQAEDAGGTCVLPDAPAGATTFNKTCGVMQFCNGTSWVQMGYKVVDPCTCGAPPSVGDVCLDESVYAGLSPDGNVRMYTTPNDSGQFAWNDANATGYVDTPLTNSTDFDGSPSAVTTGQTGQSNTTALNGYDANSGVAGFQPHRAAQFCQNMTAYGKDDWYLPAQDELNVLYTGKVAIGGFDTSNGFPQGFYWSSTEGVGGRAKYQRFGDGIQGPSNKERLHQVRCVRKD